MRLPAIWRSPGDNHDGCSRYTHTGDIQHTFSSALYANAFDIDVFVRRTLVYTLLTATLAVLYVGLILGSQVAFATFSPQASQSPLILVGSTPLIAALFHPRRHCIHPPIHRPSHPPPPPPA